jgi:putative membrane protein
MITLAPEAMEDLPEEVSKGIIQESNKFGFTPIIIDAHNSILEQTVVTPSQVQDILKASSRVLRNLSEMRQSPVACGSANDPLKQFSLVDGIGLGGLAVTLVKTDSQLAGYVTIDGNNMHQGFRQIILESLKQLGISEAEVMTTDTHLVTGLVAASRLGYYPIGAHLSHSLFLEKLGNTVKKALANIAPATLGFSDFTVTLEVLGQNAFDSITRFIGRIASRIAHYFYWLELSLILLSSLVLYVFL